MDVGHRCRTGIKRIAEESLIDFFNGLKVIVY